MPKRTSLPSMLPPACIARDTLVDAMQQRIRLAPPPSSRSATPANNSTDHRREHRPAMLRRADHLAQRDASVPRESERSQASAGSSRSGVGFSNGCALFALKKPPPLVPSILIASCEATGPCAIVCVVTTVVVACHRPGDDCLRLHQLRCVVRPEVLHHALRDQHQRKHDEIGSSTHSVPRVRSTQKLPSVFISRRAMPRMNAIASAMPTAADQKLCVASPSICVR